MLVLLRHPECVDDVELVMVGQRDSPLTSAGRTQARDAAETLSSYRFDAIYSSDLIRALDQTREVVKRSKFPGEVLLVPELRERSGGSIEGVKYSELKKTMPPRQYKLWERDYFEAPPAGESLDDLAQRVLPWFRQMVIPRISVSENVLVVSHVGVIRVLISYLKKIDEQEILRMPIEHAMPYFFYGTGK